MTRAFNFLKYCFEQSGEDEQSVDFLDHLETTWQMGIPGLLGYVTGIADLLDFRRFNSLPGPVLQNFSVTEIYIKRARQCSAKQIRSYWTTDLDTDSLESKRIWASLAELQTVIPCHSQRYKTVLRDCKKKSSIYCLYPPARVATCMRR